TSPPRRPRHARARRRAFQSRARARKARRTPTRPRAVAPLYPPRSELPLGRSGPLSPPPLRRPPQARRPHPLPPQSLALPRRRRHSPYTCVLLCALVVSSVISVSSVAVLS